MMVISEYPTWHTEHISQLLSMGCISWAEISKPRRIAVPPQDPSSNTYMCSPATKLYGILMHSHSSLQPMRDMETCSRPLDSLQVSQSGHPVPRVDHSPSGQICTDQTPVGCKIPTCFLPHPERWPRARIKNPGWPIKMVIHSLQWDTGTSDTGAERWRCSPLLGILQLPVSKDVWWPHTN